jgi:hypothetical protein
MYYHCRPIKYVEYDKVYPYKDDDNFLTPAYKWLSNYCGYCPQIWLSRSKSSITGYKIERRLKKRKHMISKRSEAKISNDSVMFGFDIIKGFPISYQHWEFIMNSLLDTDVFKDQNASIIKEMNEFCDICKEDNIDLYEECLDWVNSGKNLDIFLRDYVFKEVDQIVVSSLNLKSAKKIICHNEKQKKKLRKMGFIEDRIEIKNIKPYPF